MTTATSTATRTARPDPLDYVGWARHLVHVTNVQPGDRVAGGAVVVDVWARAQGQDAPDHTMASGTTRRGVYVTYAGRPGLHVLYGTRRGLSYTLDCVDVYRPAPVPTPGPAAPSHGDCGCPIDGFGHHQGCPAED